MPYFFLHHTDTPSVWLDKLIRGLKAKALLADKGYTSKSLRRHLQRRRIKPVIPPKSNLRKPYQYSKYLYKKRNRIERCFNRLKHFRRFATRYDRNDAFAIK